MDFKFSKDSGETHPQESPGEKKKQSALLVLLLILVGGFTYLYFFTGLIKPLEVQKAPESPAPVAKIVKIPLPAREGEPAKPNGTTPDKTDAPKAAAPPPASVVVPAVKPAAVPAKPAAVPSIKAASVPGTPKEAPKKPQSVPVADKKGDKAAVTTAEAKKSGVADKKTPPAQAAVKKAGSKGQAKSKSVVIAKKTATGPWTLLVGNYALEETLSADMGRVRKSGFKPIVTPAGRKKTTMNRLLVSEFNDRATAQSTLERLKHLTSDAFIIEQGGKFAVYAGSYLLSESARSEKKRLNAAGFPVTVKHTEIAIPTQSLSVGPFGSKKGADAALGRLKSAGIKATPSQK